VPVGEETFELAPRRRLIGLSFGGMRSSRRGVGSDIAGSRPYRPGDDMRAIDWASSARLSAVRAADEFIVREHFAEEAPRVVLIVDRRPEMSLFPPELPWLSKPDAVRTAALLISDSAVAARGLTGYLDFGAGEPFWRPPRSQHEDWRSEGRRPFGAPADTVERSLRYLFNLRPSLPPGTFVFVVSDFIEPPTEETWYRALERRWDLVPVIVQDPTWERTFPDVSGTMLPVVRPESRRVNFLRVSRREATERRRRNEERWERLLTRFTLFDLDPVVLSTSRPGEVLDQFTAWAEHRIYWRGRW
jgi:uncharacterized protein (DUF58 family)